VTAPKTRRPTTVPAKPNAGPSVGASGPHSTTRSSKSMSRTSGGDPNTSAETVGEWAARVIAAAPPLTAERRSLVRRIVRPGWQAAKEQVDVAARDKQIVETRHG
jgi:hypothetical protein